jgi:hypothetical protein
MIVALAFWFGLYLGSVLLVGACIIFVNRAHDAEVLPVWRALVWPTLFARPWVVTSPANMAPIFADRIMLPVTEKPKAGDVIVCMTATGKISIRWIPDAEHEPMIVADPNHGSEHVRWWLPLRFESMRGMELPSSWEWYEDAFVIADHRAESQAALERLESSLVAWRLAEHRAGADLAEATNPDYARHLRMIAEMRQIIADCDKTLLALHRAP